ncbi:MAG TPA: hypothetical protein VIR27_15260, partial [Mycobacteriales bacterium]
MLLQTEPDTEGDGRPVVVGCSWSLSAACVTVLSTAHQVGPRPGTPCPAVGDPATVTPRRTAP